MSTPRKYTSNEFLTLPDFIRAELVGGAIYTDDWTSLEVDEEVFRHTPSESFHVTYRLSVVKVEEL